MILDKQLIRPHGGREANKMNRVRKQTVERKINDYSSPFVGTIRTANKNHDGFKR